MSDRSPYSAVAVCCTGGLPMVVRSIPVARLVRRVSATLVLVVLVPSGSLFGQGEGPAAQTDSAAAKCRFGTSGRYDYPQGVTLADALQGKLPGVAVTSVGGGAATGAGMMRIRGTTTLGSNMPLLYIDDIRVSTLPSAGPRGIYAVPMLEFVELSQIKRIEVLRGPDATLRYGQGAAAGVIKIYTRRGRVDHEAAGVRAECPTP